MSAATDEKGYRRNPTPPIHRSKGSFINIFDMPPSFPSARKPHAREEPRRERARFLSLSLSLGSRARGFHRNNMLIARRRTLKSAPINSRDFWRNFVPSRRRRYCRRRRSVFRKILFARGFPASWENFTLPRNMPLSYIHHRSDALLSADKDMDLCRLVFIALLLLAPIQRGILAGEAPDVLRDERRSIGEAIPEECMWLNV